MGKRLVRDRALDNWCVPGAEHQVRPVKNPEEHRQLLCAKLLEEVGELILAENQVEVVKEAADVLSVLQAFVQRNGVEWRRVLDEQLKRDVQGGGFMDGLVWENSR